MVKIPFPVKIENRHARFARFQNLIGLGQLLFEIFFNGYSDAPQ